MNDSETREIARAVVEQAKAAGLILATAESCTGGMIAASITDIAGSSAVFDRGFVTYSNEAKRDVLEVGAETLQRHGAVSPETAREMAFGALSRSNADIAISVTGIAGPDGGSAEKPVGLVYMGIAEIDEETTVLDHHFGDIGRDQVREATVRAALKAFLAAIERLQPVRSRRP